MSDLASQALAQGVPPGVPRSFRALADRSNVPCSTPYHRARGRRSRAQKAQSQQYLTAYEETALVKFLIQQDSLGRSVRIKHLREIAYCLSRRQRSLKHKPNKPPGKNWPQHFCKRHEDVLKASRSSVLDWNRFDIYDKAVYWFEIMQKVLPDRTMPPENVYNMDETGVMLSKPNGIKVLACKTNQPAYRGARIKQTTVTVVECVCADGKFLHPMVIWPASTHRANWITHPTPGWHYALSEKGYTDSFLSLEWLQQVFNPQTKERANKQYPRVLICDGFGTHETLEILEFCFANNILLCRIPSHSSHKLQPLDISVFGPLKTAYRDQVDRLERAYVGTIGKEHFAYLYHHARSSAFTSRNIRSGWAKAGLYPFYPEKVLEEIPKPPSTSTQHERPQPPTTPSEPVTPVTPCSARAVSALQTLLKDDVCTLDEERKWRFQRHLDKLTNATQISLANCSLLNEQVQFLAKMNNEAKVRRAAKPDIIGKARVMCYEDLENARKERALKRAKKEAKKATKDAEKATKDAEAYTSKSKLGRKPMNSTETDAQDNVEPMSINEEQLEDIEIPLQHCGAPIARMW